MGIEIKAKEVIYDFKEMVHHRTHPSSTRFG